MRNETLKSMSRKKSKERYEVRRDGVYPREWRVWDTRWQVLKYSTNSSEAAVLFATVLNQAQPPRLREIVLRLVVRAFERLKNLRHAR